MRDKLNISEDLSLPLEAVTETLGLLGRRGSGKSYAAHKLAEEMYRCDAQFVALDPVGIWYGLRLDADGKRPGLPIPVLGGLHGDIPLEATGGALIADLVVDRGESMVLDVSQFESDTDKARFATAFGDRFFFRKKASPSAVHLFVEECQEFIPQNPQKGEERMLHAFTRMVKIGRNFGIGMSMISQRPQEVNKKALNLTELLFAFQLTGTHERKRVEEWIRDKDIDEDIAAELPKLDRGEPHVWSPSWLKISRRVKIAPKHTFDASATPKVGKGALVRNLGPIDLDQLRVDMAATIEKARADDPRLLRAEIVRLKAEAKRPAAAALDPQAVADAEHQGYKRGKIEGYQEGLASFPMQSLRELSDGVERFNDMLKKFGNDVSAWHARTPTRPRPQPPVNVVLEGPRVATARGAGSANGLDKASRAFLTALSQRNRTLTRDQVALFSCYSASSGHVDNTLGPLRANGYIAGGNDAISITHAGRAALGEYSPLPTGKALQDQWEKNLDTAQGRFLRVLCAVYPSTLTRAELAVKSNYSPDSGHVDNSLGPLRSKRLIRGRNTAISAADELFEEG